ncbi:hypothetical protein OMP43_17535 [Sphingomonas sp. CBMAI 2297]|uniref:hypothetical protein n=1 Tax=Sphingomonas sp. CBMAI 2297 TaxID=2991720 RepID=UPI0024575421|nr:hypothetical protein [Sphingomonas sp. CBMAI 2297]MDH4745831.1 hypothetical protein [Sphingomonas sp. CBMAI 2297]
MAKPNARTGTAPFAHLLSFIPGMKAGGGGAAAATEDEIEDEDRDEQPDAEDDTPEEGAEDDAPDQEAETDDGKEGKRASRRARRAEKDEDEEAEGKAESDDDDEEMAQARREGYLAAQARGRRIFGAASAGLRPDMAAHLAFNDEMPSTQAIAMLDMATTGQAPAESGSRLHRRMSRVVLPNPGTGGNAAKPRAKGEVDAFVEMAAKAAEKAGIR